MATIAAVTHNGAVSRSKSTTRGSSIRNTLSKAMEAISKDHHSSSSAGKKVKDAPSAIPTATTTPASTSISAGSARASSASSKRSSLKPPSVVVKGQRASLGAVSDSSGADRPSSASSVSATGHRTLESKSPGDGSSTSANADANINIGENSNGVGTLATRRTRTGTVTQQQQQQQQQPQPAPTTRHRRTPSADDRKSSLESNGTVTSLSAGSAASGIAGPSSATLPSGRTLRPRTNGVVASSALPKYRSKSGAASSGTNAIPSNTYQPPASPTLRVGTRRKLSNSDEEEKEDKPKAFSRPSTGTRSREPSPPMCDKASRPISPLPQRAAFKVINSAPQTPTGFPTKMKPPANVSPNLSAGSSSVRPSKTLKTPNSAVPTQPPTQSGSASSPSGCHTPQTPRTPIGRNSFPKPGSGSGTGTQTDSSSACLSGYLLQRNESPLAKHSRKAASTSSVTNDPTASAHSASDSVGDMSRISEDGNESEEEEADVELLLAPAHSPGQGTPSMPRISQARPRKRLPHTPSRSPNSNSFNDSMSSSITGSGLRLLPNYASLNQNSSPSLRPPNLYSDVKAAMRGSILSWEQLAAEASRTLGEDEVEHMLSDVPAPFRSGPISPSLSTIHLEIPESPCLSTLSSPGGHESISQMLLPDVTPSPAVHHHIYQRYDAAAAEVPIVDAAFVTLLRLQLASAEAISKERLNQMQKLEEELHMLKLSRTRETRELGKQVEVMEEQLRSSLELREKADEEKRKYMLSLEEQLRSAQVKQERAIEEARRSMAAHVRAECMQEVRKQEKRKDLKNLAKEVKIVWGGVKNDAEMELEVVRADKEVLSVFLQELEVLQAKFISCQ